MDNTKQELTLTAHFEEYKILSQEIQQRVDRQEQLSHLSVIVAGGLVAAYGLAINNPDIAPILLVFPMLFCLIIWHILRHDVMISTVASYLNGSLRVEVNRLLEASETDTVWNWEIFRYNLHLAQSKRRAAFHRFLAFVRYTIPFVLAVLTVPIFFHIQLSNNIRVDLFGVIAVGANLVFLGVTLWIMVFWVTQPMKDIVVDSEKRSKHDKVD